MSNDMKLKYNLREGGVQVWDDMSWIFIKDGRVVSRSSPNGLYPPFKEERIAEALEGVKMLKLPPVYDAYIRFGGLPSGGRSKNWATGKLEAGVSCYEAAWDLENGRYTCYGALPGAEIAYLIKGAPIYLITGEEVGRGSDGEPILKNVAVVSRLKYVDGGYEEQKEEEQ